MGAVKVPRKPYFWLFVAGAAALAGWRTAVVDWGVWFAPVAWLADVFGIATTVLFIAVIRHRGRPVPPPPRPAAPFTVDALVPTVNEPLEVLEPAVIGATRMRGVRRVLVLDDGARPEVAAMAARHGAAYHARADSRGAKAGNLNHGLRHTDADLVVTLDADHVPMPDFLEHTVGHFADPEIAFVQTPQAFYNTDTFTFRRRSDGTVRWYEQGMFYECVQPAKNAANSAFYTGTGAVLRRAALDEIGGFATGTATEDIHTSLRLHARGWRSVFVPRPLAYGLEVDNLREFYRTRRRWAAGSLGLLFRSPDSPLRIRGLTIAQRLSYLSSTLAHLQGAQRLAYLVVPLLSLITLHSPVDVGYGGFGAVFVAFAALSLWLTRHYGGAAYHPWRSEVFHLAAAPSQLAGLRGILSVERKFRVTTKNAGRSSGWYTKLGYALLAALAAAGLLRAGQLALAGDHSGLVLWSAAFLALNAALLANLFVSVARYERRPANPAYARLGPEALYRYLLFRFDPTPVIEASLK